MLKNVLTATLIILSCIAVTCFFLYISRYMKNFKPVTAANMLQCLQKHNKYTWASNTIEERMMDCRIHEVRFETHVIMSNKKVDFYMLI